MVQEDIKNEMDRLVVIYKKIIEKESTLADKIAKLEMLYGNSKVASDLLSMFLETFGDKNNSQFFLPLYKYNP